MGIVSSKLAPMAIKLAWICQRLLDPMYSSIEDDDQQQHLQNQQQNQQQQPQNQQRQILPAPEEPSSALAIGSSSSSHRQTDAAPSGHQGPERARRTGKSATLPANFSILKYSENSKSVHQQNRNRRAAQLRYKTRPSSFDAALVLRGRSKSSVILASKPSHVERRRNVRIWDDETSSSGCSSESGSESESDSETELRVSGNASNDEGRGTAAAAAAASGDLGVSAEEEEAFRLTVGRGHFTRSKKDRFLNHLRLEKRLNDLNNDYFDMACLSHRHRLQRRRHSGDLQRIL